MKRLREQCLQFSILSFLCVFFVDAADWPGFRGPNGSGVSEARGLPVEFGPNKNVLWKVAIPRGASSPVLVQDRVLLTAADGKKRLVICLASGTGKRLWERSIEVTDPHHRHPLTDHASPTALTEVSGA